MATANWTKRSARPGTRHSAGGATKGADLLTQPVPDPLVKPSAYSRVQQCACIIVCEPVDDELRQLLAVGCDPLGERRLHGHPAVFRPVPIVAEGEQRDAQLGVGEPVAATD